MDIYYLLPPKAHPAREISNPYSGSHVVRVQGPDYYGARANALRHADEQGERYAFICVGHCSPVKVLRRDWAKHGYPPYRPPINLDPTPNNDHGILGYVNRLLEQHAGAVLLPPLGAVAQVRDSWDVVVPCTPMVVGYNVKAALRASPETPSLEYNLIKDGYRVITLGDCAYVQFGPTVMDTYGTASKWKDAYEKALQPFLPRLRSRD